LGQTQDHLRSPCILGSGGAGTNPTLEFTTFWRSQVHNAR
jgi:hypothetical protein